VTFSTKEVFAVLMAGAYTPASFSFYLAQEAEAFAPGITDAYYPFIKQPSRAQVLNLRPLSSSHYTILPVQAPDDQAINLHLRLFSTCNASVAHVTQLLSSSEACARLKPVFWLSFRGQLSSENIGARVSVSQSQIAQACSSSCFLQFHTLLSKAVETCSSAWKECPASCFSEPLQSSAFPEVSKKQAVARRLVQKLINVAEAERRTSTFCEVNHLNSRCTAISPWASSAEYGGGMGGANANTAAGIHLETCTTLSPSSPAAAPSPSSASSSASIESPWTPPFHQSDAAKQALELAQTDTSEAAISQVECPGTCAEGVSDYVYSAGCCAAVRIYIAVCCGVLHLIKLGRQRYERALHCMPQCIAVRFNVL